MYYDPNFKGKTSKKEFIPFVITKPADKIIKKKVRKPKAEKRKLDMKNTRALLRAYGLLVVKVYPSFIKIVKEDTKDQFDWYYNRGSLLWLYKYNEPGVFRSVRCRKLGEFKDPEDVALTINSSVGNRELNNLFYSAIS